MRTFTCQPNWWPSARHRCWSAGTGTDTCRSAITWRPSRQSLSAACRCISTSATYRSSRHLTAVLPTSSGSSPRSPDAVGPGRQALGAPMKGTSSTRQYCRCPSFATTPVVDVRWRRLTKPPSLRVLHPVRDGAAEIRPRIGHRVPARLHVREHDLDHILRKLAVTGQQEREPEPGRFVAGDSTRQGRSARPHSSLTESYTRPKVLHLTRRNP